jgi:pimeloyl-ACP methyl ester carboxylesterase
MHRTDQSPTARHRALAAPDGRFARIDGVDVHHVVAGSEDATVTVVLLHHFFGSAATWRQVTGPLADAAGARVVAFDRPAFGLTERVPAGRDRAPYRRRDAARITVGLLDHLGVERAVLVGSSAGGTIALETIDLAPARVAGLGLVAPAITGDIGPPAPLRPLLRHLWPLPKPFVARAARGITPARISRSWHDPSLAAEQDAEPYRRALEVPGWDRAFWDLMTAEPTPDLRHVLARIEVPTVVVQGAQDPVIRPHWSSRTAGAIPAAEYVELPGVGHTPQEERPDLLLPPLVELVGRVRAG